MSARKHGTRLLGGALLLAALALPAQGQAGDSRWLPFVGCWVAVDSGDDAGMLCLRPSGAGVEMFSVGSGQVTSSETLVADGVRRPVSAEGCTGGESVEFSQDGLRAFTSSQFDCGGQVRSGTGVMSFIAPNQWIDVRSLSIDGEPVAWVQRYSLADREALAAQGVDDPATSDPTTIRAMRQRASRDIEPDDVEEAASRVDTRAVEVWVATQETEFELTGDELVRLADAGVPESVIDVMVAVSYPERFVVSPEGAAAAADRARERGYADPVGYRRGFRSYLWDPFYGPAGFGYSPYGYMPYGYYGFGSGFGGYGGYGGYYGYRPATIVVQPRATFDRGRIVNGRGYTRGSSGGGSSQGATPRPSSRRPSSAPSSGGGDGGDSGGSASGGGSSSGSSGGRTARPRGGG